MHIAENTDEIEILKDEVAEALKSVLSSFKLSDHGLFVQASTLGSLEALLDFLKESKFPVSIHVFDHHSIQLEMSHMC